MYLAAFVAAPGFGVVDAKLLAYPCYVAFGYLGVWGNNLDVVVGSCIGSAVYRLDKLGAAVGIYGVVAAMVGNKYLVEVVALGYAYGYRQHDAVAERHNGRLHIVVGIMALGDGIGTVKQA